MADGGEDPTNAGRTKPKDKGAARAGKPRTSAATSERRRRDVAAPARRRSGGPATGEPASRLIDQRIRDLSGWRGETLARMRALILEADPEMTEEWKWMGTRSGRTTGSSAPGSRTRRS